MTRYDVGSMADQPTRYPISLDLTDLPSGMYILVLSDGGAVYREKVVIR